MTGSYEAELVEVSYDQIIQLPLGTPLVVVLPHGGMVQGALLRFGVAAHFVQITIEGERDARYAINVPPARAYMHRHSSARPPAPRGLLARTAALLTPLLDWLSGARRSSTPPPPPPPPRRYTKKGSHNV